MAKRRPKISDSSKKEMPKQETPSQEQQPKKEKVMSNRIKAPKLLGKIVGLEATAVVVAALVYARPWCPFTMPIQVETEEGTQTLGVEYGFEIDTTKNTKALANRVMAAQQRLSQVLGMSESATQAREALESGKAIKRTRADLADADLLTSILEELDDARDKRLLELVARDENGRTRWNFTDEEGQPINLTQELLDTNLLLAQKLHGALDNWESFTAKSSEVAIKTNQGDGMTGSTPTTQEAL